jgi:Protein of unknown function (DUF3309)
MRNLLELLGETLFPRSLFSRSVPADPLAPDVHTPPVRGGLMGLVLLIILVLLLLGAIPRWNYSRDWGYLPSGLLGVILIVVVILLLTGQL